MMILYAGFDRLLRVRKREAGANATHHFDRPFSMWLLCLILLDLELHQGLRFRPRFIEDDVGEFGEVLRTSCRDPAAGRSPRSARGRAARRGSPPPFASAPRPESS